MTNICNEEAYNILVDAGMKIDHAPTYAEVHNWLFEKYNTHVQPEMYKDGTTIKWLVKIFVVTLGTSIIEEKTFVGFLNRDAAHEYGLLYVVFHMISDNHG